MKPPEETDTFQYKHYDSFLAKRKRIIWDYKDKKGILHSGVVESLDEALEKAKKFGYQSNETAESKSQHDLVRKSYTHKSPSKIKRKIKCACLTTLIAAARPVIDAISVCSSCGRAVCNKCVYIGRKLFHCQACGDSEFKIKKTLTERIRKSHSTWTRRCLRAIKKNEFDILAACFCVCLLAGSIKGACIGAKKGVSTPYNLKSGMENNDIMNLENKEIMNSMIYTGVLAGTVPFFVANFVMLYNVIYNKKYNI